MSKLTGANFPATIFVKREHEGTDGEFLETNAVLEKIAPEPGDPFIYVAEYTLKNVRRLVTKVELQAEVGK